MSIQDDIDDANFGRLEREARRQSKAQTSVVQYLGTDATTGQARVISGSGAASVRVANHSNTQARPGDIKRGFAGGFDRGNVARPKAFVPRRQKTGDIIKFVNLTYSDRHEFWIGGDRSTPELILTISRSQEDLGSSYTEKYGPGLEDWGLSVRTQIKGTSPTVYRIRYLAGSGASWSFDTILGGRFSYRGSGFWSINTDRVAYSLIEQNLPGSYSNSLFSTVYRNYGRIPPGGLSSFLEWEVGAPQSAGGEEIITQNRTRSISYDNDLLLQAGYPPPSHSYSYSYLKRTWNEPINNQIPLLGPPGGTYSTRQCTSPGNQTIIATAIDTRYHIEESNSITGTASSGLYSFALFNGQLSVNSGSRNESNLFSFTQNTDGPQNAPRNIYEVCSGEYFNGSWTYLAADPIVPLHTITSSSSTQSENTLNGSLDVFITPTIQLPYPQTERDASTGRNDRLLTRQSIQPFSISYHESQQTRAWQEVTVNYRQDEATPSTNINIVTAKYFFVSDLIQNGALRQFSSIPYLFNSGTLKIENSKFNIYKATLYDDNSNYNYYEEYATDLQLNIYQSTEQNNQGIYEFPEANTPVYQKTMLAMPLPDGWERRETISVLFYPAD